MSLPLPRIPVPMLACTLTLAGLAPAARAADPVPLTVATVAMNVATDTQANLQTFYGYMEEASRAGAHLIVFPEASLQQNPAWRTGGLAPSAHDLAYLQETAETIPGPSTAALVERARQLHLYVIFGMTEASQSSETFYNTSVVLGPQGVLGAHHKSPLKGSRYNGNEDRYYTAGSDDGTIATPMGVTGLLTGVEGYVMNKAPDRSKAGAQLMVSITATDTESENGYRSAATRTATVTGLWHVASDQAGPGQGVTYYGHSMILDPEGNVIAETGRDAGMVVAPTTIMVDPDLLGFVDEGTAIAAQGWATLKSLVRPTSP